MNHEKWNKFVLIIITLILCAIEVYSLKQGSHYKYDFIFLMLLLYMVLNLHPLHFALFSSFLVMHNLGVFGFYAYFPLGLEFDYWAHATFGFAAALILFRFYDKLNIGKLGVSKLNISQNAFKIVAILVVLLGSSALHEIYEYGGALAFGEGEGVLFIGAGDLDEWDTQKDMLNNLIGGILGLGVYSMWNLFSPKNMKRKNNAKNKRRRKKKRLTKIKDRTKEENIF